MVELSEEPSEPELGGEVSLFPPARVARLRSWLEVDRPGAALRDAKLLLVSSDAAATCALARLLQRLPGAEIEPAALRENGVGSDDLVGLGRVAVDPELGFELVHVPSSSRFAPVWPVAGHGAIATVLLLAGPVAQARQAVAAAAQALGGLPRARVFHVLLLEKSERLEPEEVMRNLSLMDESSLYLVPLESPEKAGVLLRELFVRILP